MEKKLLGFLVIAVIAGFLVAGCKSSSGSDSGGSGADFDSALYYTKTEIDSFLATVSGKLTKPVAPGNDFNGGIRSTATVSTYAATGASWPGNNKIGVLMIIGMQDTAAPGNSFTLNVGTADTNSSSFTQVSCAQHQTFLAYFPLASGTTEIRAWCTTIGSSMTLTLSPAVWFNPQ